MKKAVACICILCAILIFCLSACNTGGTEPSTPLGNGVEQLEPSASANPLPKHERDDWGFLNINTSANLFSYDFAEQTYSLNNSGNFAVSPISVYMALSIAAQCAAGQTREEIVSALGISYDELAANFAKLYKSLIYEWVSDDRLITKSSISNSIWLNSGLSDLEVNDDCLITLANNFFCDSFSADFVNENKQANQAIRQFVKQCTNNLIDKDFNFPEDVSLLLLNTLYLKDLWDSSGEELPFTKDNYSFVGVDGTKSCKLLQGDYSLGRIYEDETFTHYYTRTARGYKVKFILPKDGYSVAEVFTANNIEKVNAITDYRPRDVEKLIRYNTRCLFPEFQSSFDGDVSKVLQNHFGIKAMFDLATGNFGTISNTQNFCASVRHAANLSVNRFGIEGAAVTVMQLVGAVGPDEYTDVYIDFVLDRAFGYVITDYYDTVLFAGVVNQI